MKPWDELSRTEKIQSLFDYPASMRDMQAKDLWGPSAGGYYEHIYFPAGAPWKEIVEVIKNSHSSHTVYLRLTYKDFKVFEPDYIKSEFEGTKDRFSRHEYVAFTIWKSYFNLLFLNIERLSITTLVASVQYTGAGASL